jgi:hypothetical protein
MIIFLNFIATQDKNDALCDPRMLYVEHKLSKILCISICVLLYFFAFLHHNNPARDLDAAMFVATCLQVLVWLVPMVILLTYFLID